MKKNIIETIIGFIVIIITVFFVVFIYNNAKKTSISKATYQVYANFQNVDGIASGSDIMISGIKVGKVSEINLDKQTYQAVVKMQLDDNIKIPSDSKASISSSSLLGGNKFIAIDPGAEDFMLKNGDQIIDTSSPVNLESLIGKFMYSMGNKSTK